MTKRFGDWMVATGSGWFPLFLFSFENPATETGLNVKWRLWLGPLLIVRFRSKKEQNRLIQQRRYEEYRSFL